MTLNAEHFAHLIDRDRLIGRLQNLVRTASENPPGEEAAAGALTAELCEAAGLDVSLHEAAPGRPNVVARLGAGEGRTVCYCSHIDVVPAGDHALWASDPFDGAIADGWMHGRGTADAKGPVAAALEAVEILRAAGAPIEGTLELALVSDEETMGFKGAGYLVSEGIIAPDLAIVGEPTSLRVVRAQRGACWLRVSTTGVAGHGSAPERGVNAIRHMSEIVLHLEETLPDISHEVLGGPSINVGTISGGAKVNIVPASCVIEVDRRSVPQETQEDVLESVRAAVGLAKERFPDLEANVEVSFFADSFEVPEDSPVVTGVAASVADATGAPAELIGFRGASDARFLFESGADVVVCGPGDIRVAHTARESVDLAELERCALAYALSFARLLAPDGVTT
ncbi:MAG: M20 family metallopeptidase [Actinomycetota bacterium]|nr:M20 family metallopeptidase [Actinomycetota bacterium]